MDKHVRRGLELEARGEWEAAAAEHSVAATETGAPSCGAEVVFSRSSRSDATFRGAISPVLTRLETADVIDVEDGEVELMVGDEELLLPVEHVWAVVARDAQSQATGALRGASCLQRLATAESEVEQADLAARSSWLAALALALAQRANDRAMQLAALKLRTRALLMGGTSLGLAQAGRDIGDAVRLAPADRSARRLVEAVKQRRAAAKRKNRKLSREVATWVRGATDL
jgi:hypothetical protein